MGARRIIRRWLPAVPDGIDWPTRAEIADDPPDVRAQRRAEGHRMLDDLGITDRDFLPDAGGPEDQTVGGQFRGPKR